MKMHAFLSRTGLSLVLSSPSGAGKTTLARKLLERDANISLSISATTRPVRPGEVDGKDYFFKTEAEFQALVSEGQMLEYAKVFDHYYGTPKQAVLEWQAVGQDVLFDIDWQGCQQLRDATPQTVVSIFILPPSAQVLRTRLEQRADNEQKKKVDTGSVVTPVQKRMAKAQGEIQHWREYDYVLINDDLEETLEKIQAVLHAERYRRQRNVGLDAFVTTLQNDIHADL